MSIDSANVAKLREWFEDKKFTFNGVEAWSARDLQRLLGYDTWRRFREAIERAVESCATADRDPARHFLRIDGKLNISPQGVFAGAGKNLKGTKGGRPREEMILSRSASRWRF